MEYLEVALAVRPEAVEAAADILRRYARGGVSIEPGFTPTDEDHTVTFDEDAPAYIRAWLPASSGDGELNAIRRDLRALGDAIVSPPRTNSVTEESWSEAWKRFFPVLRAGKRLVVRPSWKKHRARKGDIVITLDPGMAFGTGQHETTRMCLEALEARVEPGMRVLDVGCGSGILSIAAALLGADRVDALDIDAAAVAATEENAARNGVASVVRVKLGSPGETWPFRDRPEGHYDIVVANLSSLLIQENAPHLIASLSRDGLALLSGFVAEQEAACGLAIERSGGVVGDGRADGEWRLLAARKSVGADLRVRPR